jgi:alkylation response protein AidB-like acyl-CoA dehydrogenase
MMRLDVDLELPSSLAAVLAAGADDGDQIRRLPDASVCALEDAGFFRLCLPVEFGGPGFSAAHVLARLTAVSKVDGAAGWCSMISSTTSALAGFVEARVARQTFGVGRAYGGVFAPNGRFVRKGDRAILNGRWQWGSGLHHCDVVVAGAVGADGERRTFIIDADHVELIDTWHTVGMRGSGSVDFAVSELEIDLSRSVEQMRPSAISDDPICRFPNFALLASAVASVGAGIAERALSDVIVLASDRRPQFSSRLLAEHATVQSTIARLRVSLDAASTLLYQRVGDCWEKILRSERPSLDDRVGIRSAAVHLVSTAGATVDEAFSIAGGSAVYETSTLGRCLRDVHVVAQHIMVSNRLHESLGRHVFGLKLDDGMI